MIVVNGYVVFADKKYICALNNLENPSSGLIYVKNEAKMHCF